MEDDPFPSRPLTRTASLHSISQKSDISDKSEQSFLQPIVNVTDIIALKEKEPGNLQPTFIPSHILETLSSLRDMCGYSATGGHDKKRWRGNMNNMIDKLQTQIEDLLQNSIATKQDLTDLTTHNDNNFTELFHRLDILEQDLKERAEKIDTVSYADIVKSKRPEPATIVIKPSDPNTSLGQLKQSVLQLPCPNDIVIKNMKSKPSHFEIRANNSAGKEKLKDLITQNLPNAVVEEKRPRSVKLIFHNANRVDSTAFRNTLSDLGFSDEDIPDFKNPHTLKSKSEGDVHWVLTLNRSKALDTVLRNYRKDRPNFLHVGLHRLYYREYTRLLRCRHCQALDLHSTMMCNRVKYCENCGEKDCKNQPCTLPPVCINCFQYNGRLSAYKNSALKRRDPSHRSSDPQCPTFRQGLINKINNKPLDYSETQEQSHNAMAPKQLDQSSHSSMTQNLQAAASAASTSRTTQRVFTSSNIQPKDFLPSFVSSQSRFN